VGQKQDKAKRNFETTRGEKDEMNKGICLVTFKKHLRYPAGFLSLQYRKIKKWSYKKNKNKGERPVVFQCRGIQSPSPVQFEEPSKGSCLRPPPPTEVPSLWRYDAQKPPHSPLLKKRKEKKKVCVNLTETSMLR